MTTATKSTTKQNQQPSTATNQAESLECNKFHDVNNLSLSARYGSLVLLCVWPAEQTIRKLASNLPEEGSNQAIWWCPFQVNGADWLFMFMCVCVLFLLLLLLLLLFITELVDKRVRFPLHIKIAICRSIWSEKSAQFQRITAISVWSLSSFLDANKTCYLAVSYRSEAMKGQGERGFNLNNANTKPEL